MRKRLDEKIEQILRWIRFQRSTLFVTFQVIFKLYLRNKTVLRDQWKRFNRSSVFTNYLAYYLQIYFFRCIVFFLFCLFCFTMWRIYKYKQEIINSTNQFSFSYQKLYRKPIGNIQDDIQLFLTDRKSIHPLYGMPFHSISFDKQSHKVLFKENHVTPQDNAFFLSYLLKQYEVSQKKQYLEKIHGILEKLIDFSEKYPKFSFFYPNLLFDYHRGLCPFGEDVSLNDNAWLTWTLASIKGFLTEKSIKKHKNILVLIDHILKNQNYALFYNKDRKLMSLHRRKNGDLSNNHAMYIWEDDVLAPLWVILHDQISHKEGLAMWKKMKLITSCYNDSLYKDSFIPVPLTRYGNLEDLLSYYVLLPECQKTISMFLDNAVTANAIFSDRHQYRGFLGTKRTLYGRLAHSGIPGLALFSKDLSQNNVSLRASIPAYQRVQGNFLSWTVHAYYNFQHDLCWEPSSLALLGAVLKGSVQENVKQYLVQTNNWTTYKMLLIFKTKDFQDFITVKRNVYPQPQSYGKPPSKKNPLHYKNQISLLSGLKLREIVKSNSSDWIRIRTTKNHIHIDYKITGKLVVNFSFLDKYLNLSYFDEFVCRYNMIRKEGPLSASWKWKHNGIGLSRTKQLNFEKNLSSGEIERHDMMKSPLCHSSLVGYDNCNRMQLTFHGNSEGTVLIHDISLFQSRLRKRSSAPLFSDAIDKDSISDKRWEKQNDSIPQGQVVYLHDAQGLGNFEDQGIVIDDNALFLRFENNDWQGGLSYALIRVKMPQGVEPKQWSGLGFRILPLLHQPLPQYFFVTALFSSSQLTKSLKWNIRVLSKNIMQCQNNYFFLPISKNIKTLTLKELKISCLSSMDANAYSSWRMDHIQLFDKQQSQALLAYRDLAKHLHKIDTHQNLLDRLIDFEGNPLTDNQGRCSMSIDDDKKDMSGYFFPEIFLNGNKLVLYPDKGNASDGLCRIELFSDKKQILEQDIHLRYGEDSNVLKIAIPPYSYGKAVHRLRISHCYGHVALMKMCLEE